MKYWVLDGSRYVADIDYDGIYVTLTNGLITRKIDCSTGKTVSFVNLVNGKEFIDDSDESSLRIRTARQEYSIEKSFVFVGVEKSEIRKQVEYFPNDSMSEIREYPPRGKAIDIVYTSIDEALQSLEVTEHYEIYDGIPTIMKTVSVKNTGKEPFAIDNIVCDALRINKDLRRDIFVDSNYNAQTDFLGLDITTYGKHYARYVYGVLEVAPEYRMNVTIGSGESIDSIIAYETLFVAEYYEQRLIEVKSIYRTLAPWTLDSALFFHLISNRSADIRKAVDECKETGLEMIIQSFGSGVRMESNSRLYLERIKKAYDYGHSKGIRMGAYTLAYVKNYRPVRGDEALNHDGSHICRCLATDWANGYTESILNFIDKTGADAVEIDGPYGMLLCSGGKGHNHSDFTDSQYHQWKHSVDNWYKEIRKRNVYINAPDWHFLNGTNRTGVGYEEIAFSESRAEQLVTARIYYYKGTFSKNPSMGWGFLPLNVYHGGGSKAKFCPTDKNAFEYDWALAEIVASGVWPTLRGRKVYDSEKGRDILKKWVQVYKKYRSVLNGITVHFMPPRINKNNPERTTCMDAIMNVLPYGDIRGFVMFFNQTDRRISKKVRLPLYYTGLTDIEMPPPPVPDTKNSDVEYPVYGEEIAPLVILARDGRDRRYFKDSPVTDKEIPPLVENKRVSGRAKIAAEGGEYIPYDIDGNGYAEIEVTLEPMTYCYYTIKAE